MATLTPTQVQLLDSEQIRGALGEPTATELTAAVAAGTRGDDGSVTADLSPWRDGLSAALRETGPDSADSTVMEAADNLVKQLADPPRP